MRSRASSFVWARTSRSRYCPFASRRRSWWRTFTRIAIPLAGPGIAAAGLLAFIFCWNNFVFALILASADKQPVTVGALAFVTASGIQYGQIAAAIVLSVMPTLLLALYAQRYLVEGLSLGAVKG